MDNSLLSSKYIANAAKERAFEKQVTRIRILKGLFYYNGSILNSSEETIYNGKICFFRGRRLEIKEV